METYFAAAERAAVEDLKEEIATVGSNRVIRELLNSISGLIAVLDQHRQVIAINDCFLRSLGIEDVGAALGLRLGEALSCVHCNEEPHGCGTTKWCSTCGAAIAIVSTLAENQPTERLCALTAKRGESYAELCMLVKASPLNLEAHRFVLLFIQDVTIEQLRAALERTFFHDMGNMLTGLLGISQLLVEDPGNAVLFDALQQSAQRLQKEVEVQKCLFKNDITEMRVARQDVTAEQLLLDLKNVFQSHPAGAGKELLLPQSLPPQPVRTDSCLALRVMCNMVTNALEATPPDGAVRVWFEQGAASLSFCVWNQTAIAGNIRHRIFQRSFTTKAGNGRGIGTYSMKLIGEKLLGGEVDFTSSDPEGTVFRFSIPWC